MTAAIATPFRLGSVLLTCLLLAAPAWAGRASPDEVPGEILLKLKTSDALAPLLAKYPVTLLSTLGARPIYRIQVIGSTPVADIVGAMRGEAGVQIVEAHAYGQAPEARKNLAWAIGTEAQYVAQWAPAAIHLPQAQALSTGAGVRVAVLDTGVDLTHPALAGRLLPGRDFVDGDNDPSEVGSSADAAFGHGTHVAGLVALVAPGAKIMPLRVLGPDGSGSVWAIAQALLHAVDPDGNPNTDDGAQIINLSLGTLSKTTLFSTLSQLISCNPPARGAAFDLSDPGYNDDKSRCRFSSGAFVVAAAGNDASTKTKEYPAAEGAYGLLPVAASDSTHHVAAFSNSGGWVALAAPGDGITSAFPGGGYATWSGTSMAAPLAAGTAALLRAREPALAPKDMVPRLERSSALLCGSKLGQLDALAVLNNLTPVALGCP